jgi:hypothetical protein
MREPLSETQHTLLSGQGTATSCRVEGKEQAPWLKEEFPCFSSGEVSILLSTKNSIYRRAADGAVAFESRFTVLHRDALSVLQLGLLLALDAVVQITCHWFYLLHPVRKKVCFRHGGRLHA